jgi:hypothetical protein
MPNILRPVQAPADVRQNVFTFNSETSHFYDRAARLLRETTYWVYDQATESFGPSKFVGFAEMSFDRYVRAVAGDSEGSRFDGAVTQAAISAALGTAYREDEILRARLETWGVVRFGPDAFGGADRQKWRFVSLPAVTEPAKPRLSLDLHRRYTRADVYGLFDINYDSRRTRNLNVGLSPQIRDGGYQLFVTLDKDTLAPDYDYEDILFQDQLIWVTRRGAVQMRPKRSPAQMRPHHRNRLMCSLATRQMRPKRSSAPTQNRPKRSPARRRVGDSPLPSIGRRSRRSSTLA